MSYARLYLDGSMSLWALAKCDSCQNVHRYSAGDAVHSPVDCLTCGRKVDVRDGIRDELTHRPDIPAEILRTLA